MDLKHSKIFLVAFRLLPKVRCKFISKNIDSFSRHRETCLKQAQKYIKIVPSRGGN